MNTDQTTAQDGTLIQRGQAALLCVAAFPLALTDCGPESLIRLLELIGEDSTEILDNLKACGLPTFTEFRRAAADTDDEAAGHMLSALQSAGGWLLIGEVPGSTRGADGAVAVLDFLTSHCLFWGESFDAALGHAVVWAEGNYGNNDF